MSAPDSPTTLSLARYTPEAKAWVAGAQALADERRHAEVEPLHLLVRGLQREAGVQEVFRRAVRNLLELEAAAERALAALPLGRESAYLSTAMLDLLERAEREAARERATRLGIEHVLSALSQEIRGAAGEVLGAFGVAPGTLRPHLGALRSLPRPSAAPAGSGTQEFTVDLVERVRRSPADPVIGRVSEVRRLLTILERRDKHHPLLVGEPGVGKGAIVRALCQRIANGDVPTSLAGARLLELEVGKLVAGARLRGEIEERVAKLIASLAEQSPDAILVARGVDQLFGKGPAGAAVGELLGPALARGEFRMLGTTTPDGLRQIGERDAAVLRRFTQLFVEEPTIDEALEMLRGVSRRYEAHHKVRIGEDALAGAVRLARRYLSDRKLPDSALDLLDEAAAAKRVETDGLPERVDRAITRLGTVRAQLESLHGTNDEASERVRVELKAELDRLEPDVKNQREALESRRNAVSAVKSVQRKLEEARGDLLRAQSEKHYARIGELEHSVIPELEERARRAEVAARNAGFETEERVLEEADVAATLAQWTGVPVNRMLEGEAEKLLSMEQRLAERVVGQDQAVLAVARAVRRGRVGLRDPRRPIGSFLFLGPSGVGKTELAKALAEFLFDDEQALTRLDMSEFMERHMAQRLIGAPPGYADAERGGFLTEAVRHRPYSVLLFDEVEKAHEDVFNLLLQVLDDGRLTDGMGRSADFSNTVILMTSNIGSERILDTEAGLFDTAEGRDALRDVLLEQLRGRFRPEFLNRIDDIVVFRALRREDLLRIVEIQLAGLGRLLAPRGLRLELGAAAKQRLVELGYEPSFGARPLRRAIVRELQDPLAEALLRGGYASGTTIRVELEDDKLVFRQTSSE
jgi:ATP-dependent Clp protease ATP-binding subunit ClpB